MDKGTLIAKIDAAIGENLEESNKAPIEIHRLVKSAYDKFKQNSPNQRDFKTAEGFQNARKRYDDRMKDFNSLIDALAKDHQAMQKDMG